MEKVRVYELAKKFNIPSKEFVEKLKELDIPVKSHMSILEGDELKVIEELFTEEKKTSSDKKEETVEVKKEIITESSKEVKKEPKPSATKDSKNNKNSNKNNRGSNKNDKKKPQQRHDHKEKKTGGESQSPDRGPSATVEMGDRIVIKDLAAASGINVNQIIMKLIPLGVMANQNQEIDFDHAQILADEFKFKVVQSEASTDTDDIFDIDFEDSNEDLQKRPPVVTVMGHVDHGKTSLLDAIRNTKVTKQEAGGITQHIGASTVYVDGNKVIFLDTPGHEAFTAMRSRGAQITDIAILVVAADDGVMPQTVEAINHAKAAGVPVIVAINKMDKPSANVDRIKQELVEHALVPEDWGGDTITVPVSALKREGIDDLLEMVLMVAEMEELKANPNRRAVGTIIEARLDKGKGPVATVLVQKGTLKFGDTVVTGQASGRIRAMFDDKGKNVKKATPSIPVQILGLSEVPESGDLIYAVTDEKTARSYAEKVKNQQKEEMIKSSGGVSLDDLFGKIKEGELKDLNIVIKTDVRGTIDAVKGSLEKLSNDEVRVNVIHGGVGGIRETDVMLASASNAIIIGFNVRPSQIASDVAQTENVDIRTYRVIYDAIEDIQKAINGMLAPTFKEEVIGRASVRAVFKVPNVGNVAGVYITNGKVTRNASIRLLRDDVVITEAAISSLKRFKDDVKELNTGYEGGIGIENYNDIKEGDVFEAFVIKEVARV